MKSINPSNGELIREYAAHTPREIASRIARVAERPGKSIAERALCMKKLAALLRAKMEECARLMTLEMGKPITQARTEVLKCAMACDYFAEHAAKFLQEELTDAGGSKSYVTFQPLGVILGVMPWNYPFWQVFRFAAPTLMAGNGVLIKHAPNVTGCMLAIESLVAEAGLPLQALLITPEGLKGVIEDPRVQAVTLTGSPRAGRSIAALAGQALKKSVLELGGSDPFIVLEDADMARCASTAVAARMINNGQSCIAAKRFIVVQSRFEQFCRLIIEKLQRFKIGDPLLEETEAGPLARADLLDTLEAQLKESLEQGAHLLYGGKRMERDGYFFLPAVVSNVKKGMRVYEEETFGPLFALIAVKDSEEAVQVANDSLYGLGASVWTQDRAAGERIAARLETGMVFLNAETSSKVQQPFGGVKQSGYGRELSHYGIKEFVNIKSIYIH